MQDWRTEDNALNIALCSAFRNAQSYIDRYFAQIDALNRLLTQRGDTLTLMLGYGDSTDDTDALLFEHTSGGAIGALLIDCTHGGPVYGSVVNPERFRQLAYVANKVWRAIPTNANVVAWAESDLTWEAQTMLALIDGTKEYPAVAPMVMLDRQGWSKEAFYDVYAFRKDGKLFRHNPPYFDGWPVSEPVQIDSAGSCMALRGELVKQLTWTDGVFPELCQQIYRLGGAVWLDARLAVKHG